jgi:hypothetical protein
MFKIKVIDESVLFVTYLSLVKLSVFNAILFDFHVRQGLCLAGTDQIECAVLLLSVYTLKIKFEINVSSFGDIT